MRRQPTADHPNQRLSGVVDDIGKDILDSIYVTLSSGHPIRSVQVLFDDEHANRVASLSKGSRIVVVGRCEGLMMNVLISDADFVDSAPQQRRSRSRWTWLTKSSSPKKRP